MIQFDACKLNVVWFTTELRACGQFSTGSVLGRHQWWHNRFARITAWDCAFQLWICARFLSSAPRHFTASSGVDKIVRHGLSPCAMLRNAIQRCRPNVTKRTSTCEATWPMCLHVKTGNDDKYLTLALNSGNVRCLTMQIKAAMRISSVDGAGENVGVCSCLSCV